MKTAAPPRSPPTPPPGPCSSSANFPSAAKLPKSEPRYEHSDKAQVINNFYFFLEALELRMELEWEERERKGAAVCGFMSLWALLGRKEEGEATAPHSQHATRRKAGGNHLARHATAADLPHGLANLRNLRTRAALPYIATLPHSSLFFFFQFCRG
jgi:hypothetical protein